jgi:predicted kinase
MMATLHLLHGFTGAGKTTFARKLETELLALRFTPDEWIVQLYGNNPPEEHCLEYFDRVTNLIWKLTMQLLRSERDVILDFGFWSRVSRDEARSKA